MWRWADVREDVKMSRCEDEQMWTWADVKMSRCERRCEDEQMWRWADVREDLKMSRCEDEKMWEKIWRWADVKMRRCERRCEERCEDEQMWRWEDVREDVKMSTCEDEKMLIEQMWRWEDVLQTPTIRRTLRSDALGKKMTILEIFGISMVRNDCQFQGIPRRLASVKTLSSASPEFPLAGAVACRFHDDSRRIKRFWRIRINVGKTMS